MYDKGSVIWVATLCLTQLAPVYGHQGARVLFIPEVTEDMLTEIDLKDGSIEEWELMSEPTLTALEFSTTRMAYDPSDLDFRMWLGWNAAHDWLYVAAQVVDDEYVNTYSGDEVDFFECCDRLAIVVDGDHSAGSAESTSGSILDYHGSQFYQIVARVPSGPLVQIFFQEANAGSAFIKGDWMVAPPYSDGGGGVFGESPTISVMESYVTPFDRLLWKDREASIPSDLA